VTEAKPVRLETPLQMYRRLTEHPKVGDLSKYMVAVLCYVDDVVEGKRDYNHHEFTYWLGRLVDGAKIAGNARAMLRPEDEDWRDLEVLNMADTMIVDAYREIRSNRNATIAALLRG
jgi:hypothetical protein